MAGLLFLEDFASGERTAAGMDRIVAGGQPHGRRTHFAVDHPERDLAILIKIGNFLRDGMAPRPAGTERDHHHGGSGKYVWFHCKSFLVN